MYQMIFGAIQGGFQAYQESELAREEAKYQRNTNVYNAQVARNEATEVMHQEEYGAKLRTRDSKIAALNALLQDENANRVEEDTRVAGRRFRARQRANQGMSGFAVDEGSNLTVDLESARLVEYEANVAAYGLRMDAFKSRDDAKMLLHEAEVHSQRATFMRDHGIRQAGAQFDSLAAYYKKWAQYYDDSQISNIVAGVVAGAFGGSHSIAKPGGSRQPGQQPGGKDFEKDNSYDYETRGDIGGIKDTDGGTRSLSDYNRSNSGATGAGSGDASSADAMGTINAGGYM